MSHFDADVNKVNINAIHDIQDVYIKQDEGTVFKNEVANDALDYEDDQTNTIEEDDNMLVNNEVANAAVEAGDNGTNSILQNILTWVPIVYTTRLDEMNIFDKIEKYTPKEAAVLIQYESKPQYKQILPIKREPCNYHSYSFMKLYSDIERLNQKVQTETKRRNEELMSMCRPLKIVLKRIKYDETKTTDTGSKNFRKSRSRPSIKKILMKPKMTEKELVKSVAKFQKRLMIKVDNSDDSDSLDEMPLTMLKPCVINSIQILPGTTTIAFLDKISMKANIFIINYSKDLRCSYETNSENFNFMKTTNRTKNTVVYDVCCWVKREKQIKLLSQSDIANENTISFMRIPHGCLPAPCTCCCISEPPMPMQSSVTFLKMSSKKMVINTESSKLIRKAYSSITKLQSSNILCAVDEPIRFLKSAVIMMKYKEIIFSQGIDLGENYEIGMEGDIDNHVKLTVNRSLIEERQLYEKHDEENKISRQYFSYIICCWYKREEIIVNMSKVYNLSPRSCKYMRNPHLCKSHKCQCCCKRAKIGLLDDNNIATLSQSKKQSKGIRENKKMNPVAIEKRKATKIKKVIIDKKKYENKTVAPGKTVDIEKKTKNKQNSVGVMVSHCEPETIHTISQTVVQPSMKSQPNVVKTIEPPTASSELITSIFDKFRELKLSVNANGKLTANINTPPEKLLPVEIKALADQLAKASNQMHELGIGPEEFCRRVNLNSMSMNASPSTERPNIPLPPKLPIIAQSSPFLPQESISPPPLCPIVKKTVQYTKDMIQPPQASKRVKQKSQPCKTNQININFPRTTNSSKVANLYSMMSHTGWVRNKCMIAAYNIHFDLEMDEEPEPEQKTHLTNVDEQQLPKIISVQSLVESAPNTNIISNASKQKEKLADKPESKGESCKIRVLPPERISTLPISTQMNMISLANLATLTNNSVYPKEPIPSQSQQNIFDRNGSLNPIQNVNGALASPLPNAGNNVALNSGAPTIHIPDFGKIWAYIDGKLVELKVLSNAANQNNIASHQNYGIPKIGTGNNTPMITVSNGIPMQISRLCADIEVEEDVKAPTVNVEETQENAMNALLRDMLSKDSPLPNLPQPTPRQRYANSLKRTVTPLILEHSKELKLKKRKVQVDSNPASKEKLHNAVPGVPIEIMDSDEEQESIFGV